MTESHTHAIISTRTYFIVFAALCVLLLATVGAAYLSLGPLNIVIALAIAFTKAILVAMFFMHLRYSKAIVILFALAGVYWFGILLLITAADFIAR